MALNTDEIVTTLRADTSNFSGPIEKSFKDLSKQAEDFAQKVSGGVSKVGQSAENSSKEVNKFSDSFKGLGVAAAGIGLAGAITVPIINLGREAVMTADSFKRMELAFTTLLGSGEKAKSFMKELENIALKTPFEFTQLSDASKRLMAMGIEAEKIPGLIMKIGDAVAGLGSGTTGFNRITLALGQMNAAGRVTAGEMRQLTEAGIGAWDMLAKHLNITVTEAMERVHKKQIDAVTGITAITEGMGQKFAGMMEKNSSTIEGMLANMHDTYTLMLAALGQELIETLKLPEILKTIGQFAREFLNWFRSLDEGTKQFILIFTGALAAAGPILIAVGAFMAALAAGFGPLMAGGAIISALIAGVTTLAMNWDKVLKGAIGIWTTFKEKVVKTVQETYEAIKQFFVDKLNAIVAPIKKFGDDVLGIFKQLRYELVGGSEVPDMLDEIAVQFKRLDEVMVGPVRIAAQAVQKEFKDLNASQQAASRSFFKGVFDAESIQSKNNYGPDVRRFNAEASRKGELDMQRDIQLGLEKEAATRAQISADLDNYFAKESAEYEAAEAKNQQYQGQWIVMQEQKRQAMQFGWKDVFGEMSQSAQYAFGQIRNDFGRTVANMVQGTANWKQFWQETQNALINSFVQFGIDMVGKYVAKNAMILATEAATALSVSSIWEATGGAVLGTFGAMTAGIQTFFIGTIMPMFAAVGEAVMTFLASLATALDISIFGAPFSIPVWAGVALIAAAVGAISAFAFGAFAEGGIVKGPMMGLVGEAGPEAIIPLDKLGGLMNSGEQTINIYLDGKVLSRSVYKTMPTILRQRGMAGA